MLMKNVIAKTNREDLYGNWDISMTPLLTKTCKENTSIKSNNLSKGVVDK